MRQVAFPLRGLRELLDYGASFQQEHAHVSPKDEEFRDSSKDWELRGDSKDVGDFGPVAGQLAEVVVVLHGAEGAVEHGVLKEDWWIEAGDASGEGLLKGEVAGAPGDLLAHADEACGLAGEGYCGLTAVNVIEQANLDAAGEVEAAVDGCIDK